MASWEVRTRTKNGFSLTVSEIVELAIKKGFSNIESIKYGTIDIDGCRKVVLTVNSRSMEV